MKIIKYNLYTKVDRGTESEPNWVESLTPCEIACATQEQYDANLPIILKEAHNGKYTVEGEFEEESTEPSQLDIIEAQVTYTAMMTDTLLEV